MFTVNHKVYKMAAKKPNLEWERIKYTLPKSKAQIEIIREIVIDSSDNEFMEVSDYEPN